MDLTEVDERIRSNVLGRLMHGQRELFHSNLLAWFFDALPDVADAVFRPLSTPGEGQKRSVQREQQNMDLVMHWPDLAPLVIENKVFALPDMAQLKRYAVKTRSWQGSAPSLVLLSMTPPPTSDGEPSDGWRYLSYQELADRISVALPNNDSYEVATMRKYTELVRDLHGLFEAIDVQHDSELVWIPNDILETVSSTQTRAAMQKARAQRIAHLLEHCLEGERIEVKPGMTQSGAFVESFHRVKVHELDVDLGWQLQGQQFRRAVRFNDARLVGGSREAREAVSREHPEFFTFAIEGSTRRTSRSEFNHFAPNFVYRYVKAPDLSISELKRVVIEIHEELGALEHAQGQEPAARVHRVVDGRSAG